MKDLNNNYKNIKIITYNYKLIINKNYTQLFKNIKVLNKNSIFLTGIPIEIDTNELKKNEYLGQYGKVINIIKSKNQKRVKLKTYSIFVTFENEVSCAIAINSLNNFKFESKIMKCSYASNKVCIEKLFNGICDNSNCYFFHGKLNKNNSIIKILDNTNLKIIEFFSKKSFEVIKKNYINIIDNFCKKELGTTIFPNINIVITNFFKTY